jgi:hypothetical protein
MSSDETAESAEELRQVDFVKVAEAQEDRFQRERRLGLPDGWALEFVPRVLPVAWREMRALRNPGGCAFYRADGLKVLCSANVEDDGKRWVHVSCSYRGRMPTWEDLRSVKSLFVGEGRCAYQVLPSKAKYVNLHPHVLHLFACLDGEPLPDFTGGTSSL